MREQLGNSDCVFIKDKIWECPSCIGVILHFPCIQRPVIQITNSEEWSGREKKKVFFLFVSSLALTERHENVNI